ncbi:MAG: thiamine pyrophosphate-binding protein [Bacillota bacterium]|jgi:acetolactate synthase-1/2/3 large subunit|nr:thiamine pyrophosphate-binding protein [Bacillota bacterium]HHU43963.1 thiamine pyrophosphate-binding protein [Clostridiales bacterium]
MKLTGGEIVLKQLIEEKVPYILGIPGHGVLALFDAVRREEQKGNIKYIQVKHEQTATAIADGYFRVSGKPLAVFASIGPGTLNTAIGLATAYVDSTAFLTLCGDTHTHMKGVGVLQEIERYQDSNIIRSLEPLAKRSWRAESAKQLPRIVRRAFNQMTTGRSGPCVISLPMDVQADSAECNIVQADMTKAKSLPSADMDAITAAIELMKKAKRPVILAGGGALRRRAEFEILSLAEKWGAAVVTTLAGKGAVKETHPQYAFHTGSKGTPIGLEICKKADVILALGARFADETTCSYRKGVSFNFPDTKLIHIDIDAGEIGKNYGADIGILGDLKDALEKLNNGFGEFEVNKEYLEEIKALREKWFDYLKNIRSQKSEYITISQLIGKLNEILPKDTIIATSSGNTQAQLFQEYCYEQPYCNLTTGGFSTMGWAVPAAMGAKLALPNRPVVALLGDGDFMMIMQELSTMAQYEIPVIVIMANNAGWMAIKDLQIDAYGKEAAFGNDFMKEGKEYSPDFAKIAEAFHIDSYDIREIGQLEKAVKSAIAKNKPAFINVEVSRQYPLTGGKAFGWWDVPVPTYDEDRRKAYERARDQESL